MIPQRLPIRTAYPDTYGDRPQHGIPWPAIASHTVLPSSRKAQRDQAARGESTLLPIILPFFNQAARSARREHGAS